jgi:ParB/RepB/Spo0J family partition protein
MNEEQIQMIEISQVFVANPRPRNPVTFQTIVASIDAVELKKPILVTNRASAGGGFQYELVCGQGGLEACAALGKTSIPAIIMDVTREQLYLMSLVENIARLERNRLKGTAGNAINAVLAAAAMNFHKLLGAFWRIFLRCLQAIWNGLQRLHGPEALHTQFRNA